MIVDIVAYAALVALLVAPAAHSLERLLAELRLPTRFAWFGAYTITIALPVLSVLLAEKPPPVVTAALLAEQTSPATHANWDTTVVFTWIAATAIMLALYGWAWLRLMLTVKRWPIVQTEAGTVVVTDDVGPAVFGILTPRVVLPRWLMQAPVAVRRTVMIHELEHIGARDQIFIATAHLIAILLPWNLALWWFARRLRSAIEVDCDARVLRRGVEPSDYAEVLLAVGQHRTTTPSIAAALTEPITQLERRIRIMLMRPNRASKRHASAALALTLVVAACTTQLEAPTLPTASAQPLERASPGAATEAMLPLAIPAPAEPATLLSGVLRLEGPGNVTMVSDKIVQSSDGTLLLEGNVQLVVDKLSITTPRAFFTTTPDGRAMIKMDTVTLIATE
jgi:hypothetical protein